VTSDLGLLRAVLFAPAGDERKLRNALASAADAVAADLEDATAPDEKAAARETVEVVLSAVP
jgi:citrate lyase beta subunit